MTETQARSGSAGAGDVIEADNDQIRAKCISLTASLYEADDAIQEDTDDNDNEDDDIQSTDSEFDMERFDDDGGKLVDQDGRDLVPFDPEESYEEEQALFLVAFANTYREVRGQLQASRVGRDQKVFNNNTKQTYDSRRRKFFVPGRGPKRPNPQRKKKRV